jgi:hypothetical protein
VELRDSGETPEQIADGSLLVDLFERVLRETSSEVDRRDAVLDWLAESTPRVLELCPYKVKR